MRLLVIADAGWGIGKDGDQQIYIPADLKRFQTLTGGGTLILGRKTLATFPGGRPLKNRRNLILSTQPNLQIEGAEVFSSLDALRAAAPPESFVIGGESVYAQCLPFCGEALVTRLDAQLPADRFFPDLDADPDWELAEREGPFFHEGLRYHYLRYRRAAQPSR